MSSWTVSISLPPSYVELDRLGTDLNLIKIFPRVAEISTKKPGVATVSPSGSLLANTLIIQNIQYQTDSSQRGVIRQTNKKHLKDEK